MRSASQIRQRFSIGASRLVWTRRDSWNGCVISNRNAKIQAGQAQPPMIIATRSAPPFFKNGFVLGCEDTREGVVIDPGDDVEALVAAAAHHRLTIRYILLTHAHLDHITGVAAAKKT